MEEFAGRVRGKTVIADKGYVSGKFAGEMEERGVKFIAIKRKNMIKSEEEAKYYRRLSKLRRRIETLFSIGENFGLRFIRAVSRRGLVVKIILSLLAFNIYRYMVMGTRVLIYILIFSQSFLLLFII